MSRLYVASSGAFAVVSDGGARLALEGAEVRCLAAEPRNPDAVYAGTSDEGLFKSEDGGGNWERLPGVPHERITALAVSPVDGAAYAGAEPSALFVSRDGGLSWRELGGLRGLPSAPAWSFPPRPWTSHVSAIALSHEDQGLVVAGVELGGVVRSADGGETWQDQRPGAYADCHALAANPAFLGVLYEAAGGGFASSADSGESWEGADDGLPLRYVWGLAVDPADPGLVHVSAAPGPAQAHGKGFSDAAIYSRSGAGSWKPVLEHLPEFPYALAANPETPGSVYAGFSDGNVYLKPGKGKTWRLLARMPGAVAAIAAVGQRSGRTITGRTPR